MKVYYLHVARDALHANTFGLSEPRVDARAQAYASRSVCTRVISVCARDKELTRSPTRIQGLSECTIYSGKPNPSSSEELNQRCNDEHMRQAKVEVNHVL